MYQLLAVAVFVVDGGCHRAADGALFVAAAEEVLDAARLDGEVGAAAADIGRRHGAVAAAEDPAEAATLDEGGYAHRRRGVAAAEDRVDGVVTAVDMHRGALVGRRIVGQVAAAEDSVDGEGRVGSSVIAGRVLGRVACAVDIDKHAVLRGAVGVVAAIDRAGAQVTLAVGVSLVAGADIDIDLANHTSLRGVASLAEAAAVDVACNGAVINICRCFFS